MILRIIFLNVNIIVLKNWLVSIFLGIVLAKGETVEEVRRVKFII